MLTFTLPGKNRRSLLRAFALALPLTLIAVGCASTPQASRERDADAKQFSTHPGSATLYVYRPDSDGLDSDTVLWIDGKLIGATLPKAYFRVNLSPGKHTLNGMGHDNGTLSIETRPGELTFVAIRVAAGANLLLASPARNRPQSHRPLLCSAGNLGARSKTLASVAKIVDNSALFRPGTTR
jgi:hypothetical protein